MIVGLASFLGTVRGFVATMAVVVLFGVVGALVNYSDRWLLAFTLYLSVFSVVQSGCVLVAQDREKHESRERDKRAAHRDEAMHHKLDTLVRAVPQADDALIGTEKE